MSSTSTVTVPEVPQTVANSSNANTKWSTFENWVHCICIITFDLEIGQALECTYPKDVQLSKQDASSICYLAFPDSNSSCIGDTVFIIRFESQASDLDSKRLNPVHTVYNKDCPTALQIQPSFYWGHVYFRQVKDNAMPRGYLQKSVIILTKLPFDNLFRKCIELVAHEYFEFGENSLPTICDQINQWQPPIPGTTITIQLLNKSFQLHIPSGGNYSSTRQMVADCENGTKQLSCTVDEFNYFDVIQPVVSHIHLLWELILTTEPLVVMASSPTDCSQMVLALTHLIAPLRYCGDFKPYFTIHDKEFKIFTYKSNGPPPVILGVTNPFFIKTLHHWPHTVRLDKTPRHKLKKNTNVTVIDSAPGLYTSYKTFLQKDKAIIKKLMSGVSSQRPFEAQSALLKRHLLELSQSFMIPLERYIASLMPLQKNISPFKAAPIPLPFNPLDFFSTLDSTGPQLTTGIKGDWIGLYKRFIRSANFNGWFNIRYQELVTKLQRLQLEALSNADLKSWVHDKAEVEIVDMVLKLKTKITQCNDENMLISDMLKEQLNQRLNDIISSLPEDLKNILRTS